MQKGFSVYLQTNTSNFQPHFYSPGSTINSPAIFYGQMFLSPRGQGWLFHILQEFVHACNPRILEAFYFSNFRRFTEVRIWIERKVCAIGHAIVNFISFLVLLPGNLRPAEWGMWGREWWWQGLTETPSKRSLLLPLRRNCSEKQFLLWELWSVCALS